MGKSKNKECCGNKKLGRVEICKGSIIYNVNLKDTELVVVDNFIKMEVSLRTKIALWLFRFIAEEKDYNNFML